MEYWKRMNKWINEWVERQTKGQRERQTNGGRRKTRKRLRGNIL